MDTGTQETETREHQSDTVQHVVIVGAGLAGCLGAVLIAQQSALRVTVLEYRHDPRQDSAAKSQGRSINLALSTRGLTALRAAGLDHAVEQAGVPMHGRCAHNRRGGISVQPYGQPGQHLLSVSRRKLNEILLDACDSMPSVEVIFGAKCTAVDLEEGRVSFTVSAEPDDGNDRRDDTASQSEERTLVADLIVGADGTYSRVRSAMERQLQRFDCSREHISAVYKELTISADSINAMCATLSDSARQNIMPQEYLHVWPRRNFMLIALPNTDGSFTCTLFMDETELEQLSARGERAVHDFFYEHFPDAAELLPKLGKQFFQSPTSPLVTLRCKPFNYKGRAVLIGDAAHAIVPFYGQGCNAAFEDCVLLATALHANKMQNMQQCLSDYASARKANADTIADLAIEHYNDMASGTASLTHILRRRVGIALNRLFPHSFVPLYTMVTFSNIPYAEAVRRAKRQEDVIQVGLRVALATVAGGALWYTRWKLRTNQPNR